MNNKQRKKTWVRGLLFAFLLVIAAVGSGCGERTESTSYYYSPSWTNASKIVCIGGVQTVRRDIFGSQLSSSYVSYIMTMYQAGTGESGSLVNVTDNPAYTMSYSPNREYVAYLNTLRGSYFDKITMKSLSTEAFTGMEDFTLTFDPKVISFDWSSNGNQIVYCTSTEVRVRDWNDFTGTADVLVTAESDLEFVSWKYGNRVAFVYTTGGNKRSSLIYSDGSGRTNLALANTLEKLQVSPTNTNEVYGIAGTDYVKVNVNSGTSTEVSVAAFSGQVPRISPDGTKIVYSKTGESSGIYLMNLSTGAETPVK